MPQDYMFSPFFLDYYILRSGIIYQNQDGSIKIDVRLEEETVWLTQAQMAMLFGKARTTITEHIQNVYKEGELNEDSVSRNFRLTADDGKSYDTCHYNLDVVTPK